MNRLRHVVLHHQTRTGSHYDWMLEDPRNPAGLLWTCRIDLPPSHWQSAGRLLLIELPPHRRAYLTRQGRLTDNRGWVRQVDAGHMLPLQWTISRRIVDLDTPHVRGRFLLTRLAPDRWNMQHQSASTASA